MLLKVLNVVVSFAFAFGHEQVQEKIPGSGVTKEGRLADLARIKNYELIDVEYSSSTGILKFSAFDETFSLLLSKNEKLIASNIKHGGNGVLDHESQYVTSLTESCHYHVKELRWGNKNSKNFYGVGGGLSICNKRGLRGHFWHSDESYMIKPAKFYLGDISNDKYHDISDKHLIYKVSDYDDSGFEWAKFGDEELPKDKYKRADVSQDDFDMVDSHRSSHGRKLFQYNNGKNYIETGVIVDRGHYVNYYSTYGNDWYEELFGWTMDWFNVMSGLYSNANFGNEIGDLTLLFSYYDAFTSYTGNYATLTPDADDNTPDCTDFDNGCNINSNYLTKFRTYVDTYLDTSDIDNYMMWTGYTYSGIAGSAWLGTICRSPMWSKSQNAYCCGDNWWQKTIAHEFGHNLNMPHDFDTTCDDDPNEGIMGYGSGSTQFTSCSIDAAQEHFSLSSSVLSCYADSNNQVDSDDGGDDDDDDDSSDSDVSCSTVASAQGSGSATATCPDGTSLTGCSAYTAWLQLYRAYDSGDSCVVASGDRVWAYARCCDSIDENSFTGVWGGRSGTNNYDTSVSTCSSGTLTGCSYYALDSSIHGGHPGYSNNKNNIGSLVDTGNVCTMYNGPSGGGVWARARCSSDSGLQCKQIWGSISGTNDDSQSSVSCPSGYFLSSCSVYTENSNLDGSYADSSGDTCIAQNGYGGSGVYAVGICCQYSGNSRRRRRMSDDSNDDSENIYGSECDGYNCVNIEGISSVEYNITNGKWVEHGCYNDKAYYRLEQIEDSFEYYQEHSNEDISVKEYYMFKSNHTGFWHIYTELNDFESIGFCNQDNLVYCSGRWEFDVNGNWKQETNSLVTICLDESSNTTNHENTYGDKVCIYNDGSLWDDGVAQFEYNGAYDNYPYFKYEYRNGNSTIVYYLHFYEEYGWWTISANMIQDIIGVAYCKYKDLTECTYNTWYVEHSDNTMGDELTQDIEESMGYDSDCGSSSDTSASDYCDDDDSCALWRGELLIIDNNDEINLCDDSFVECIMEPLYEEVSSDEKYDTTCENEYKIVVDFQVDFSGLEGKSVYNDFMNNYQSNIKECSVKSWSDSEYNTDGIEASFNENSVSLCTNCQSFFDDESGAQKISMVVATVMALFAVYLLF